MLNLPRITYLLLWLINSRYKAPHELSNMSHTEQESPMDALKRHFAQRVTNQVRTLINRWRIVCEHPLTTEVLVDLIQATEKLCAQAQKFNAELQLEQGQIIHPYL